MSQLVGTATDTNFKAEVEDADLPTLVDFWATWCGPCRAIAPIVEDLAKEFAGRLKVMKMDVDANPQVPMRFNITGIPTVLLFKNGKIVDQAVGAVPKRLFVDMVEKHLG